MFGKKFSRDTTSRRAMYRALIGSLTGNKKLVTTYAKAKVVGPMYEKLITRARKNTLSDRRFVYRIVGNDRKVSDEIIRLSKLIVSKNGGFLTYINLPARKGDNAAMTRIEFTVKIEEKKTIEKKEESSEKVKESKDGRDGKSVKGKPSIAQVVERLSLKKLKETPKK